MSVLLRKYTSMVLYEMKIEHGGYSKMSAKDSKVRKIVFNVDQIISIPTFNVLQSEMMKLEEIS